MHHMYLERHDIENNLHRFYQLFVTPGLFDDWSLVKEWGRVGSPGTVRMEWFSTKEEAIAAGIKLCATKCKKGYTPPRAEKSANSLTVAARVLARESKRVMVHNFRT